MLAGLQGAVTDGMPALRLVVAAAQAREMMAVTFGDTALGSGAPLGAQLRKASVAAVLDQVGQPEQAGCPPAEDHDDDRPSGLPRPLRWFRRLPRPARVLAGLVGLLAVAGLIDLPFTVLALFPGLFVPLVSAFVCIPLAVYALRRRSRSGLTLTS
jgi:hypothetical protein